jgi:hypothetical protein
VEERHAPVFLVDDEHLVRDDGDRPLAGHGDQALDGSIGLRPDEAEVPLAPGGDEWIVQDPIVDDP